MSDWWLGLAPAQATVDCGGRDHRLKWQNGELRALDHADVENEQTLAALGGQPSTCLEMLGAWERHQDNLRVLVLASRGPTDPLRVPDDAGAHIGIAQPQIVSQPRPGRARRRAVWSSGGGGTFTMTSATRAVARPSGWTAYGPAGRVPRSAQAQNELAALLGLGGGLPDRLVAAVAAAWRERLVRKDRAVARARPQLHAALYGRALAAMRAWVGPAAADASVELIGEGRAPSLTTENGMLHAKLPFGWLIDVWAKDLATIWGRWCLAAESDDGLLWRLTTVAPDLGRPRVVTLQLPGSA